LSRDPLTGRAADDAGDEAVDAALEAYLCDLVAERRRAPREDLLSALVAARDGGDRLSEVELVSTTYILFRGGFSTTTNLIGNGLLALLRHPAEMARLWDDPGLAASAVEEMLRYDSPVQLVDRCVLEAVEVGGHAIGAGESVIAVIGGANRDPERFGDPERFDVGRSDNQPLSFGWGIHHCLGAPLARLEAQIVFRRMAQRLASVDLLDDNPPRELGASFRGLASLPVRIRANSSACTT
jgi:cytochrome P450